MTDASYTPRVASEPIEGQDLPPATMFQPEAEPDRIDREAGFYEASKGLALRELFEDAQITDRLGGFLQADERRRNERHRERMFAVDAPLSVEAANERFGVPGRLSFDKPVSEAIAGWRQGLAQREAFRDEVVANADVGPLEALGASLAGSILDPAGLPLWLIPELATGRALRSGVAASRLGRLGAIQRGLITGAAEGTAGGLAYEGVNLWLHSEAADDYDLGDATANVVFGGVLGAAVGGGGGWWEGRTQGRAPAVVEGLTPEARTGAFAEAFEAVLEDRPVDLGPMLARQAEVVDLAPARREVAAAIDDDAAIEGALAVRPIVAEGFGDVAVTPRGVEVPVRYGLVEADDLVTSHDDDLYPTSDYPRELQPRQRDRAGAQARNRALEAELNPKRLMNDVGAESGAPIVSRDGIVESGNGRTIAIRRSYRNGSPAAARYRAELEARGFDVTGMREPVLVRVRTSTLEAGERVRLTRDMNAETTEAYSPSERAVADAQSVDDDLLGLVEGGDLNAAGNRRFVKAFLDRVASDDLNRMTTADGRLSEAGLDRIGAAMVARAYGDRGLVEALFEATDSNIKAIGRALADAAPEWAAMRGAIQRGEAPAELDPTAALTAAVSFVRHVRGRGANLAETMDLTIGQYDAFSGSAMTPETEAFVRAFFRTSKEGATMWKSPRSADSLADGLKWLTGEIRKVQPGPSLFGDAADAGTTRTLLDGLAQWFARSGDDGPPPGLAFDGPDPTVPAGGDVRPNVDDGGRIIGGPSVGAQAAGVVDGRSAGPAVEQASVGRGAADAGRGAGRVDGPTGDGFQSVDGHFDQNHADLARLATTGDRALATDLSQRMSRFIDWSDAPLTKADAARAEARQPVSFKAMMDLAKAYQAAPSGSFYDPEELIPAIQAQRAAPLSARSQAALVPASERVVTIADMAEEGAVAAKPKVAKGEAPKPPKGQPFADPDIATLLADTDAALLRAGLEPADIAAATPPAQDPQTVADAVSAAAFCLKGAA